jgi:hypothetical protein
MLAGLGIPQVNIAVVLKVAPNTLRVHYGPELGRGTKTVEAKLVANLLRLAGGKDGTALKAIMFALQCRFGWSRYAPPPAPPPLGKKEKANLDAQRPPNGTGWGELLN